MSIIVVGDTQLKNEKVYKEAFIDFLEWLWSNFKNDIIVQVGDFYQESSPNNELRKIANEYLTKFKEVHILNGNHDYSTSKNSALLQFSIFNNIHIYLESTELIIDNKKCLMLPFIYPKTKMKEQYEQLEGEYDYIFTHFETSETSFGEGVDPKNLKGIFFLGHQHIQKNYSMYGNQHYVLGVPYPNRYGEHLQEHRIIKIHDDGNIEFIPVPQYFTFRDIEYGDEIKEEWKNDIINIKNAPSVFSVDEKYRDYNIRKAGITLKEFEDSNNDEVFEFNEDILKTYFNEFSKEKELSKEQKDIILQYME